MTHINFGFMQDKPLIYKTFLTTIEGTFYTWIKLYTANHKY